VSPQLGSKATGAASTRPAMTPVLRAPSPYAPARTARAVGGPRCQVHGHKTHVASGGDTPGSGMEEDRHTRRSPQAEPRRNLPHHQGRPSGVASDGPSAPPLTPRENPPCREAGPIGRRDGAPYLTVSRRAGDGLLDELPGIGTGDLGASGCNAQGEGCVNELLCDLRKHPLSGSQ
jgi:hypothetical protein